MVHPAEKSLVAVDNKAGTGGGDKRAVPQVAGHHSVAGEFTAYACMFPCSEQSGVLLL